jgi:hypothetical protein
MLLTHIPKKLRRYTLIGAALFFAGTKTAHAAPIDYFNSEDLAGSNLPTETPTQITLNILAAFLSIVGLIDVCIIIYAGFVILTSSGNPEKVKQGRDTIIWAVIGSIIILSALGIVLYLDSAIFPTSTT